MRGLAERRMRGLAERRMRGLADRRARRLPCATGVALALLLGLELAVRWVHPSGTVPYSLEGVGEYRSLAPELEAFGPARVSIVGSSRAREGLLLPLLHRYLEREPGGAPSVASYAIGGARAAEVELVVRKLLAADVPPDLIVYGLTPRQLLDRDWFRNSAYLWDLAGWWEERRVRGGMIDRHLPQVVRNELVRYVHAYRYREEIGAAFAIPASESFRERLYSGLSQRDTPHSPMRGDLTVLQRNTPSISRDVSAEHVRGYVDSLWIPGKWSMERQERSLGATLTRCREAGVPLVLFEVPTSSILREHLPKGAYRRYRVAVARAAQAHGVPFLSVEDLGLELARRDFREQSHLNWRGATKLTRAVAERVVLPALHHGSKP
jgi:hypothetical protein